MAYLATPMVGDVIPFNVANGLTVKWSVIGGERMTSATVNITTQKSATVIATKTVSVTDTSTNEVREFSATLTSGDLSALTNGNRYVLRLTIANSTLTSKPSNMVLLQCVSSPVLGCTSDISGSVISKPTITIMPSYTQADGFELNYCYAKLFGINSESAEVVLAESDKTYDLSNLTLRDYPMPNNIDSNPYVSYKIVLYGQMKGGVDLSYEISGLTMSTYYIDNLQDKFTASNLCDEGKVKLESRGVQAGDYFTDSFISLPNTYPTLLSGGLEVRGNTVGGGGTPSAPIAMSSVGQENLFKYTVGTVSGYGLTITITENGEITINGTISAGSFVWLKYTNGLALANGTPSSVTTPTWVFDNNLSNGTYSGSISLISGTTTKTDFLPQIFYTLNSAYARVNLNANNIIVSDNRALIGYLGGAGVIYDNCKLKIMCNLGTTATNYTPYGNFIVRNCGKNLWRHTVANFSGSGVTINYDDTTGFYTLNGTASTSFSYFVFGTVGGATIYPLVGKQITLSIKDKSGTQSGTSAVIVGKLSGNNVNYSVSFTNTSGTSVLAENVNHLRLFIPNGSTFSNFTFRVMFEIGATSSAYSPYNGTDYPIPLKDISGNYFTIGKVGTIYDRIYQDLSNGKWYCEKKFQSYTVNGSEAWVYNSSHGVGVYRYQIPFSGYVQPTPNTLCDNFIFVPTDYATVTQPRYGLHPTNNLLVFFSTESTVGNFISWLTIHPTTVLYQLATPVTVELHPDTVAILQSIYKQNGTTNLFSPNTVQPTFQYINFDGIMSRNFVIQRRNPTDLVWIPLKSYSITSLADLAFTLYDTYNANETTYDYSLVPINFDNTEGTYMNSVTVSQFNGAYVCDAQNSYSILNELSFDEYTRVNKYNLIESFGGKYPTIISNDTINYDRGAITFNIMATATSETDVNRQAEINLREEIADFISNRRAKIVKDFNGNIWLVMTYNDIPYTFLEGMGNGVANLSFSWAEIGDANSVRDLRKSGMLNRFIVE